MNTKTVTLLTFFTFFVLNLTFSQETPDAYFQNIDSAYNLYKEQKFFEAGKKYNDAFNTIEGKAYSGDRYNAACCWALADEPDSAFRHLFKVAKNANYSNLKHLLKDEDLNSIHNDTRWEELVKIVTANKEKLEENYDKPLVSKLESILETDQKYRQQIGEIQEKYGDDSKELTALWDTISYYDSINLIEIKKILDERGWLGSDIIGPEGNSAIFLVIQHSDIETQQKYLPMMREAVKNGKASPSSLALLEDRVALRTNKKQIYGSQIGYDNETKKYYVLPLEDPENVDQRRAKVFLGPLSEYAAYWKIEWNVEQFKKEQAQRELENTPEIYGEEQLKLELSKKDNTFHLVDNRNGKLHNYKGSYEKKDGFLYLKYEDDKDKFIEKWEVNENCLIGKKKMDKITICKKCN